MTIPDVSALTEAELIELQAAASQRLFALQNVEQVNRATLLDRPTVAGQIDALVALADQMSAVVAVTNADINAGPAPYVKDVARGVRRVANNTARLLRTSAGLLDTTEIGETP